MYSSLRQTCTVISDSDVVFSGEASLERAVRSALELFRPAALFVVSGCVSEMIGDDVSGVLARISGDNGTPLFLGPCPLPLWPDSSAGSPEM